jgi:2-dehydropantoate 2-reductase
VSRNRGVTPYDLPSAIQTIKGSATNDNYLILPLLNGIAHLELLDDAFGRDRVLGGSCYLGVSLDHGGDVHHRSPRNDLTFGPRSLDRALVCEALASALRATPVNAIISSDIVQDMWDKFVMFTTFAGMTCLMRTGIGHILKSDDGSSLMTGMLDECAAIAQASGHPARPSSLAETRAVLLDNTSRAAASMLRDIQLGNRTEADHVLGDMLRRAKSHGITAPVLRTAYCHLQAYEASRELPA